MKNIKNSTVKIIQLENWQMISKGQLTKDNLQMADKYMKMLNNFSHWDIKTTMMYHFPYLSR